MGKGGLTHSSCALTLPDVSLKQREEILPNYNLLTEFSQRKRKKTSTENSCILKKIKSIVKLKKKVQYCTFLFLRI